MTDPAFPVQTWPAGAVLFEPGQPARAMYLIESGEVDLSTRAGAAPRRLGAGDVFGEQAIFGGAAGAESRAVAASPLVCTVIEGSRLQAVLRSQKSLSRPVIEAVMLQMYLHNAIEASADAEA